MRTVSEFLKAEGIDGVSLVGDGEAYYSRLPCECCESEEAGDRFLVAGFQRGEKVERGTFMLCPDCILKEAGVYEEEEADHEGE